MSLIKTKTANIFQKLSFVILGEGAFVACRRGDTRRRRFGNLYTFLKLSLRLSIKIEIKSISLESGISRSRNLSPFTKEKK